ncbi:ATP-dependent nuclease [Alkalihalobacillus trypoxylicola]|uniref:Uncharacterized protein n=1 Tax=Alkalihalobacillus trypoxylicola TaxID=519424 RepID=A0A162DSS2_9BACI|nr:AAA family ATPase [Alkalihalobacillus trypoxylicola]KYG30742.1 hypothetical protein AZF04_18815 [Alkalihalobacillus trypoxylicola]
MYLSEVKIWNFRKFGMGNSSEPGVSVQFQKGFNLLIGENDAGKSAIIDAIHFTLGTVSTENSRIVEKDFYIDKEGEVSSHLKVECIFSDLTDEEAGIFLEWLSFNKAKEYELIIRLEAERVSNELLHNKIIRTVKAGPENADSRLEAIPNEVIKSTYLKPLRDARTELRPGYRSRLAQILKGYSEFSTLNGEDHTLVDIVAETNSKIEEYFNTPVNGKDKSIIGEISSYLNEFFSKNTEYNPQFMVTPAKLDDILRKLSIELDSDTLAGLGSLNLLFIAVELLLLNDGKRVGPALTLIEEVEAHLHPQAQLRLIKFLQSNLNNSSSQFILTTHSTTLAASTSLSNIILLHKNSSFPMNPENTKLDTEDYKFLERFLDATKANLFFARGVILVEGDAENLLLPALAEVIDRPLHKYGVSIVNLGNTAFKRYAKIFMRSEFWKNEGGAPLLLPVSLITDVDIKPYEYHVIRNDTEKSMCFYSIKDKGTLDAVESLYGFEDVSDSNIIGEVFTSIKDLESKLVEFGPMDESLEDDLVRLTVIELSNKLIEHLEDMKISKIQTDFRDDFNNLNVYVSPKWTLEYVLANSCLNILLAECVHNVRYKHPNSVPNQKKLQGIIAQLEQDKSRDIKSGAYELFKPLDNKLVSKAEVAQTLAYELINNKEELKEKVMSDSTLSYLIDAIIHVTDNQ